MALEGRRDFLTTTPDATDRLAARSAYQDSVVDAEALVSSEAAGAYHGNRSRAVVGRHSVQVNEGLFGFEKRGRDCSEELCRGCFKPRSASSAGSPSRANTMVSG